MNFICFLLTIFSWSNVLLAYPLDYNETSVEITNKALKNLEELILKPNFTTILENFENYVVPITSTLQEHVNSTYQVYSKGLSEVKESANNINADISTCVENIAELDPYTFYEAYTTQCLNTIRTLGLTIISLGFNKRHLVFLKKYSALVEDYETCLLQQDPIPRICAGVILSTSMEVDRILPDVKSYALDVQVKLKEVILNLSECANSQISIATQTMQTEFSKTKECILDKLRLF